MATVETRPPVLFEKAKLIEETAFKNGNYGRGGGGLYKGSLANLELASETNEYSDILEDRCHHGGCFT